MAQFDVYRNPRKRRHPLLVDVQDPLLADLSTRVVVPMMRAKTYPRPITRLNPIATVEGVRYVLVFQELAAIPASVLGARVESLAARRSDLVAALDLLFLGI